jgi:hypothetical protein
MKTLALAICTFVLLIGACGKKERTARSRAGDAGTDHQFTGPTRCQWHQPDVSRPTQYVDGRALKDLASFVIFRKDLAQSCVDCPVPYRELKTVFVETASVLLNNGNTLLLTMPCNPRWFIVTVSLPSYSMARSANRRTKSKLSEVLNESL